MTDSQKHNFKQRVRRNIGGKYLYNGEEVTIVDCYPGRELNKNAFFRSQRKREKPTYLLSNGLRVKFDKLTKIQP